MNGVNQQGGQHNVPGTAIGPVFRLGQFSFAFVTLMVLVTADFKTLMAPTWSLLVAAALECGWSLFILTLDMFAMYFKRPLQSHRVTGLISVGDAIIGALVFSTTCFSMGMVDLIDSDTGCPPEMPCLRTLAAVITGFFGWIFILGSFLLNLRWMGRF